MEPISLFSHYQGELSQEFPPFWIDANTLSSSNEPLSKKQIFQKIYDFTYQFAPEIGDRIKILKTEEDLFRKQCEHSKKIIHGLTNLNSLCFQNAQKNAYSNLAQANLAFKKIGYLSKKTNSFLKNLNELNDSLYYFINNFEKILQLSSKENSPRTQIDLTKKILPLKIEKLNKLFEKNKKQFDKNTIQLQKTTKINLMDKTSTTDEMILFSTKPKQYQADHRYFFYTKMNGIDNMRAKEYELHISQKTHLLFLNIIYGTIQLYSNLLEELEKQP